MIHLAVFAYILVIMAGIVCLSIGITLYRKIQSKLLFHFLVYFSAFTLFIFFYLLVLTYINANTAQIGFYYIVSIVAIIILSYSFLIYSILHFGHYLINDKPSKKKTIFEILISVISLIGLVFSIRIDWVHNQINPQINFGLILSLVILIGAVIYISLLKLYNKRDIDVEKKQLYKRTSILNSLFIPGFILDFYLIKTLNFSLFIPLYYIGYSVLFLQYFIEMYNADLIRDRSKADINELNNYLDRAGISVREKEIVTLIIKGFSNQKISNQLFISLSTVKTHVRNIFKKLNVESRFEIISRINKSQAD